MAIQSRPNQALVVALVMLGTAWSGSAQQPAKPNESATAKTSAPIQERGPQSLTPEAIQSSIDALGTVDAKATDAAYTSRMMAARALRRAPPDLVAGALIDAVESHSIP